MNDEDWKPSGPTMASDGSLEGRMGRVETSSPPEAAAKPAVEAPLELAYQPAKHGHLLADPLPSPAPRTSSPATSVMMVLFLLAGLAAAGGAWWLWSTPAPAKPVRPNIPDGIREVTKVEALLPPEHHSAIIDSTPPGATITVKGEVVGTTPWAGDNVYGDAEVELRLPGYQPWKGRMSGTSETSLTAKLRK